MRDESKLLDLKNINVFFSSQESKVSKKSKKKKKRKVDSKWATKKMFYRWKEKALDNKVKPGTEGFQNFF